MKAVRPGSGNDWSLVFSIHSKCIPWSWDVVPIRPPCQIRIVTSI